MRKILNFFGLYSKKQWKEMVDEYNHLIYLKNEEISNRSNSSGKLKEQLLKLPFDFDSLVYKYNFEQMNALYYKMIVKLNKTPEGREYVKRWEIRREDAVKFGEKLENNFKS